ncbi:MAG TPA: hypothetical protein VFW33_01040, partial [Gemmataceae bacterium]|nr:hypothetical protein [Gemmataceae bacterium]
MGTKIKRRPRRGVARRAALAVEPLEPRDAPAGGVTQYFLSGPGGPITAGAPFGVMVRAVDSSGVTVPFYTGTIHFTSSDPKALLPPDYTFTLADAGQHVFGATLATAGPQAITGTDTTPVGIRGTLAGPVRPAPANHFLVTGFATGTAGTSQTFTVTAQDPFGNTDTTYLGTILFFSSAPDNDLPAPYTFLAGDVGQATFTGQINTSGVQSVITVDAVNSTIQGAQTGIIINPGPTSGFRVYAPEGVGEGESAGVTVVAVDDYENPTLNYLGRVHFSSTDPLAVLPADYSYTPVERGKHLFPGVVFQTGGPQVITVTDASSPSVTGNTLVYVSGPSDVQLAVFPKE